MTPVTESRDYLEAIIRVKHLSSMWIMFYRHGMNATLTKNFYHEGDMNSAIRRAQDHCKIMGYKYIFIRPLICDLESEEEYKLTGRESA